MSHTPCRIATAAGALAALLAALPAAAGAVGPAAGARGGPMPFFDSRTTAIDRATAPNATPPRTLPADDRAARRRLVSGLGREAVLDADPVTATPRVLGRLDGTLTGAQAGDPADVALRYVRGHEQALGLSGADLSTLRLEDRSTVGGVTHVRWRQEYRGIPAFDNELRVNVDGDGRVVNVLGAPRHDLAVPSVTPSLSAAQALDALQRNVGVSRAETVTAGPAGARAETRFSTGDRARLVLFGDVRAVRLAWHLTYDAAPDAWYDAVVDATTGRVLRRANLVKSIAGRVFDNYPGAPLGGTQHDVLLDPYLAPGATTLIGPFAHAWTDLNDTSASPTVEAPDAGEEVAPGPYAFDPFTPAENPNGACDATHLCSWNHLVANSWQTNRRQNAVQAFWYANRFHDHLAATPINFTAASGNFEGTDRLIVETDDGANTSAGLPDVNHVANADIATPPDGQSPRMQMFLFRSTADARFRDANGGDDASVVYHEYTHGLSNRLVTDADGAGALNSAQSAAMGEAWSDWYAKDFLANDGFQVDTAAPGEVDMGAYLDATPHQIRTQALDCPVGAPAAACPGTRTAGSGGYTYGDFGRIAPGGPEVHADGEIWGETLWDLRGAVGSPVAEAIITEGMRLSPPEPSFLDMRNAILQADQARFGGLHINALWTVFANRGMGFFAGTEDGSDVAPVQNFANPPPPGGPTGRIGGRVTDSVTGAPLAGIVVGIGGLDTPPSSFAATTNANGAYSIGPVPAGTYPVVVFRPGAGYERFTARTVTVAGAATTTVDAAMRRDWAALNAGAAVAATNDNLFAPFGCGTDGAFDLSLGSGWSAYNAETAGAGGLPANPHRGAPPTATVRLPVAVSVTGFGVDPSNTCGDNSTAATRDVRIEVSTDGTAFTTVATPRFGAADLGRVNIVSPAAPIAGVRFVRITMLTNQSLSAAGDDGAFFTDLSEFEVFGTGAPAPATPPPAPGNPAPAPAPAPGAPPAPQPQPGSGTAPNQAASRPTARVAASRTRGRATFTIGCAIACRATATMTVSRATARRLGLRGARLARVSRQLAGPVRRTFAITVGRSTLARLRARGVRTLSPTVSVRVRDSRGQTATTRRAVRVRIR
jgi:extracellular elastinolytic metalloproteinase